MLWHHQHTLDRTNNCTESKMLCVLLKIFTFWILWCVVDLLHPLPLQIGCQCLALQWWPPASYSYSLGTQENNIWESRVQQLGTHWRSFYSFAILKGDSKFPDYTRKEYFSQGIIWFWCVPHFFRNHFITSFHWTTLKSLTFAPT